MRSGQTYREADDERNAVDDALRCNHHLDTQFGFGVWVWSLEVLGGVA